MRFARAHELQQARAQGGLGVQGPLQRGRGVVSQEALSPPGEFCVYIINLGQEKILLLGGTVQYYFLFYAPVCLAPRNTVLTVRCILRPSTLGLVVCVAWLFRVLLPLSPCLSSR